MIRRIIFFALFAATQGHADEEFFEVRAASRESKAAQRVLDFKGEEVAVSGEKYLSDEDIDSVTVNPESFSGPNSELPLEKRNATITLEFKAGEAFKKLNRHLAFDGKITEIAVIIDGKIVLLQKAPSVMPAKISLNGTGLTVGEAMDFRARIQKRQDLGAKVPNTPN